MYVLRWNEILFFIFFGMTLMHLYFPGGATPCMTYVWGECGRAKKNLRNLKMNCTSRYAHSLWFLCDYHLCRNVLCHQTLLFLLKTFGSQFVFSAEYEDAIHLLIMLLDLFIVLRSISLLFFWLYLFANAKQTKYETSEMINDNFSKQEK